jgi:sulfur-carrier protein
MAQIVFTQNIQRHIECPAERIDATTVRDALEQVFAKNPRVKSYVLDDQGALRPHVAIFVDGEMIRDRQKLSDPVTAEAEIYVMQALSGG